LNLWTGLSVCLLEAAALIASPGPRHGRRLVHWGHWTVLLVAAAAPACLAMLFFRGQGLFRGQGSLAALGVMVVLILAFNRLGRALRLSRYFRLLLAATFYPVVFVAATWDLDVLGGPGYPSLLAVVFAGPLLCAAVAMGTAIRPRRRRII
jgi:hypothetical protein